VTELTSLIFPGRAPLACGRPTRSGTPCKRGLMAMAATASYRFPGYQPPACGIHATDAERAECARINAETEEEGRAYRRSLPVACWDWEVTQEHQDRAASVGSCADRTAAFNLAAALLDDWQDGRCAACGGRGSGAEYLDHDHETGLIRGYLCRFCNGKEAGDYEPGGRFDRYRSRNPAIILGISVPYWSPFTGWAEPEPAAEESERLASHAAYVLADILSGKR
jgi:Recombination endonuclease VII